MKKSLMRLMVLVMLIGMAGATALSAASKKKSDEVVREEVPVSELTNQGWMSAVRMYSEGMGAPLQQYGKGAFRIFTLGKSAIEPKLMAEYLKVGEDSLKYLEMWTGNQKMFLPRTTSEADAYCLVLIQDKQMFGKILDFLREKGAAQKSKEAKDDLTKAYEAAVSTRIMIMSAWKMEGIGKNWVANFIGSQALGMYYRERHVNGPTWLLEGLNGELERKATGMVVIRNVSYEKNKDDGNKGRRGPPNWAKDMKKMIKKNDRELMKSSMVTELDLIGMSHKQYVQMWSFGAFVRSSLCKGRKSKNRYGQLIKRTAAGEDPDDVLKDVMGKSAKSIKRLTMTWRAWALRQK